MKPERDQRYWRRKLDAYLHDSPDKALDIVGHEARAEALKQVHGFEANEAFDKRADFAASAADRLPWPSYSASKLSSAFRGDKDSPFRHPLGGSATIQFDQGFRTVEQALEGSFKSRPVIQEQDARLAYLAQWRFWRNWASDINPLFAFMPADTRIPDHTIWNHMQIVSGLMGCSDESDKLSPSFLLFSLGPVQDFIAAARSTRDLWSGSYLLSYLIASILAEVARELGPDQVIFPNLQNQPLIDLLLKPEWESVHTHDGRNLWEAFQYLETDTATQRLLTPSLPNRFLLLVPASEAVQIGRWLEQLAREKLDQIAGAAAETAGLLGDRFKAGRFDQQIGELPEIFWQTLDWTGSFSGARDLHAAAVPEAQENNEDDSGTVFRTLKQFIEALPNEHRDTRFFKDGMPGQEAAAWPALNAVCQALHDGIKQTRLFDAWAGASGWEYGRDQNKDSLNGKEEAVLIVGDEDDATMLRNRLGSGWEENTFRAGERLGASTLLKRIWHRAWLAPHHGFKPEDGAFSMPNTHSVARGQPFDRDAGKREAHSADEGASGSYYAVLALDGDEMGKWLSGAKMPLLESQVSSEAVEYLKVLKGKGDKGVCPLKLRRPLNPSFHLQFSEMLGNFSLYCVRPIIEAFRGRLIYAGGDDVLAMLPASTALDCSYALRQAFRGENAWLAENATGMWSGIKRKCYNEGVLLFDPQWRQRGSIKLNPASALESDTPLVSDPWHFPALVPGPATDCSVGIAIGHEKAPLQDMVKAAQAAEKRAKRAPKDGGLGRGALAVSIFKRSGEVLEWGFNWPKAEAERDNVLQLVNRLLEGLRSEELSSRFPYKFLELISPYMARNEQVGNDPDFHGVIREILLREFRDVLGEQGRRASNEAREELAALFEAHLDELARRFSSEKETTPLLERVAGLFQTIAWISKNKLEDTSCEN